MVDIKRRFLINRKTIKNMQLLPWIKEQSQFIQECERCNQCIKICPQQIIIQGSGGFPCVDFKLGECTFCYQCADICPQSLFKSKDEKPWSQSIEIQESCLANHNVECRSCEDVCETRVILFQPKPGRVSQAFLKLADCTGCGACISSCPVNAITMEFCRE